MPRVALTIAGSDPSGGAGIQADLKTFHQFGVYGEAAITLITVQNTRSVSRIEVLPADLVVQQIQAAVSDIKPRAAKVGALGSIEIVAAVAELAASFRFPLVVDPVIMSKHGGALLRADALTCLKERLFPAAFLVTPNLAEAEALTGMRIEKEDDMITAGERILEFGCRSVLVKGGHFPGEPLDVLVEHNEEPLFLRGDRVDTPHTHGAGCTYSAAITAGLACRQPLDIAVRTAKRFMQRAIEGAPRLGSGNGPVDHFAEISIWERLGRSYRSRQ
jgi:hydroxymethylpyrimidine/phosphomethylpyrimidine kinase